MTVHGRSPDPGERTLAPAGGCPAPAFPDGRAYRGLSLDVARKRWSVGAVAALVERLGALGFTALHLHLSDSSRLGVALPGFEDVAAPDAWTAADAARLCEAAERARIALIPEVDLPSHAVALLSGSEDLRLREDDGTVRADRLDISRPESTVFARAAMDAASALFPGDAIHLGGDEYFAAPWEDAASRARDLTGPLARAAQAQLGPRATAHDLFARFVNDLADHARGLGRTPILWNDHVVPAREHPLVAVDPDIVLDVWIRWRRWTPSVLDLVDSGHRVINSHGDQLYLVLGGPDDLPRPHGERRGGRLEDTFDARRFMGLAAQDVHIEVPPPPAGAPDPVLGASLSVWCDAPDAMGEDALLAVLDTWLIPFATRMDAEDARRAAAADRAAGPATVSTPPSTSMPTGGARASRVRSDDDGRSPVRS